MTATGTLTPEERADPGPELLAATPKDEVTSPARGAATPRRDWFDQIWNVLGSIRFGVVLIALTATSVFLGTVIMQAPGDVQASPELFAAWILGPRGRYGEPWSSIFEALELYRVFQSLWFRGLLALLSLSIMVNVASRTPGIIAVVRRPPVKVPTRFFSRAPLQVTVSFPVPPDGIRPQLATDLGRKGYRTIAWDDGSALAIYADRNRYGKYGTFANHLGLIIILGAGVLGNVTGWREDAFMVPEGTTRAVGHDTGLVLRNEAFVEEYFPNGTASDFRSEVVVLKDGKEAARGTIRVNEPLDVGTVRFHQAFFGPAVAMRVRNAEGTIVYDDSTALGFKYDGDGVTRNGGNFVLGNRQFAVFVLVPSASLQAPDPVIPAGSVRLEIFAPRQPRPVAVETLAQGEKREIVGFTFEFVRETQFSGLQVVDNPVVNVIWIGAALMVMGSMAVFYLPLRRIWARIETSPDGGSVVTLASAHVNEVLFAHEFAALGEHLAKKGGGKVVASVQPSAMGDRIEDGS